MVKNFDNFKNEEELIEILEKEIENNEWISMKNEKKEKLKVLLKKGAENFTKKKLISIRIPQRDLEILKKKSLETGIPYQTIISTLIHQYVEGKIKLEI
jgi:predicted DNA binding CopG/RHH family protein